MIHRYMHAEKIRQRLNHRESSFLHIFARKLLWNLHVDHCDQPCCLEKEGGLCRTTWTIVYDIKLVATFEFKTNCWLRVELFTVIKIEWAGRSPQSGHFSIDCFKLISAWTTAWSLKLIINFCKLGLQICVTFNGGKRWIKIRWPSRFWITPLQWTPAACLSYDHYKCWSI